MKNDKFKLIVYATIYSHIYGGYIDRVWLKTHFKNFK